MTLPEESFSFTVWTCVLCNWWLRIRWMAMTLVPWSVARSCFIKISSPETLSQVFFISWSLYHCYEVTCQKQIADYKKLNRYKKCLHLTLLSNLFFFFYWNEGEDQETKRKERSWDLWRRLAEPVMTHKSCIVLIISPNWHHIMVSQSH